jgi:hypothetical protein
MNLVGHSRISSGAAGALRAANLAVLYIERRGRAALGPRAARSWAAGIRLLSFEVALSN